MSSEPQTFARRVLDAFELVGLVTDEEIGYAGGPSTTTLAKYRKVAEGEMSMTEPRGDVLRRIDMAAEWKVGSARALWRNGTEPEPTTSRSLSEATGGERVKRDRRRVVPTTTVDGVVFHLNDRVTDLEERLDVIASQLEHIVEALGKDELSEETPSLRSVANKGVVEPEEGALTDP